MRLLTTINTVMITLLLVGCDSDPSTEQQDNIDTHGFYARFDPANGVIPFPNNLLFAGSDNGTLNIPTTEQDADFAVKSALNALDGFSTIAPITASFSSGVDADTLIGGDTVRLFEVTLSSVPAGAVTAINRELAAGTDYVVSLSSLDTTQSSLIISPLKPLKPKTGYLVVLTKGIKDQTGKSVSAELPYAIAKSTASLADGTGTSQFKALDDSQAVALEPVRQLVNAAETVVDAHDGDLTRDDIILSWSFTTQSISDVLEDVRNTVQAGNIPSSSLTSASIDSPLGAASIYAGTLQLPYYLGAASNANDTTPLTSYWQGVGDSHLTQYNTSPQVKTTVTVPLMASIPKGDKPESGWPVVIYQHGITTNRATLLAVADAFAQAGFAAVAIDMPLHGLTGDETDGTQLFYSAGIERTFDLDVVNNTTGAAGPDDVTDLSGTHFINLSSLLTSRDNLRQTVADLFSLKKALESMDYDGLDDTPSDFDTSNVRFVGHSLGGITGAVFLALDSSVGAATLAMPGGGIAKLLDGSGRFGPRIAAGLSANGIEKGTASYEAFLSSAQMVIDAGDPLNFATSIGTNRGIHLIDIVGGNTSPSDQVIPNNVLNIPGTVPSPTAGTDPLAMTMGLTQINADATGTHLQTWVRFNAGHHGSLLTPKDADGNDDATSALVTTEIQSQMAVFLATNGGTLDISDASLLDSGL